MRCLIPRTVRDECAEVSAQLQAERQGHLDVSAQPHAERQRHLEVSAQLHTEHFEIRQQAAAQLLAHIRTERNEAELERIRPP